MSIKVMTLVWDGFPGAGSELLAMLALADWCDDRGGSLYPSIKAVGDKIRVGENHARKILRKFEQDRFLAVVGNHFGGKPGTTREYRLNIVKLKSLADEANAKKEAEKAAKYGAKKAGDDQWEDVFATAPLQDTPIPQDGPTAPLQHRDGPPVAPQTPPLQVGLSTIDPPMEPEEIGFASFWSAYPKKVAKPAALKAFKSAKVKGEELAAMLADIAARAASDDWKKEGGKYVPNPATYLNQRRWEDGQAPAAEKVRFV